MPITFRRATLEDARAFYGKDPELSFRGFAAIDEEGAVLWVGGVYYAYGRKIAFSEGRPKDRKLLKERAKAVRMMERLMDEQEGPVYAVADENEPTAGYLLAKLGFKPTGEMTHMGEFLVRRK